MDCETVLGFVSFQRNYLNLLIEDIPDERMTFQPPGIVNHPAWQLGHLDVVMDGCVGMLGGAKTLDESWGKQFGQGSKPVGDRKAYPSKTELVKVFNERRAALIEQLKHTPADVLARPAPFPAPWEGLQTLGRMICFLMTTHEGTHLGQIAMWRRAAGMTEALSKLPS